MRRVAWVAASLAVVVGVAAAALAWRGAQLAEVALREALERAGMPVAAIGVRSLGWRGILLGPLRLGTADGPSAAEIELGWSLAGLLTGQADSARCVGLRLTLAVENGKLRVRGLPELGAGDGDLPLRRIELSDAVVTVTAAAVTGIARIDARLERDAADGLRGSASIDASLGEPAERLALRLPQLTLDTQSKRITVTEGDLHLPERKVALSGIALGATPVGLRASGKLHGTSTPAAWPALEISVDGSVDGERIVAAARAAGAGLTLTGKAQHDRSSGRGQADLAMAPLRFAAGRQPADLFPAAGRSLTQMTGSIAAAAHARWDAHGLTSSASFDLDRVGFDSDSVQVRDLTGRIALASAWPPRTAGPQRLTGRLGLAGLPPGELSLALGLPADGQLRIATAELGVAGGTLALTQTLVRRGQPVAAQLEVRGVDIDTALRLIDIDGLSGTGRIDGVIPVEVTDGGVSIRDGKLAATGPGTLRYSGDKLPQAIAELQGEAGEAVRIARQALADFRYTALELTLDRANDGQGTLLMRLAGSNPAVLDDHPFVFNIRLETNFDRLALLLLDGYAAAEGLLRRATRP